MAEDIPFQEMTQPEWKQYRADGSLPERFASTENAEESDPIREEETPLDGEVAVAEDADTGDDPLDNGEAEEAQPEDTPVPAGKNAVKRINTLTRNWRQAQEDLVAEQQRVRGLEARLAALEQKTAPAQPGGNASQAGGEAEPKAPDIDDYESYEDYQQAAIQHEARRIAREELESLRKQEEFQRQTAALNAEIQRLGAQYEESVTSAKAKYSDYDDVTDYVGRQVNDTVYNVIAQHPAVGEIAYYLGNNLDDFDRLQALTSPTAVAMELGRIVAQAGLGAAPDTSEASPRAQRSPRPRPRAPVPASPPRGDRGGGGARQPIEKSSYQDYRKAKLGG